MLKKSLNYVVGYWLIVLYLLGIYTSVHLYSGEQLLVPVFVAGIAGFLLLIKNHKRIRVRHVKAIGLIVTIAWLSVLFKGTDAFFIERVKGGIQMTYSILLAYGFFLEVSKWKKEQAAKLFYYACLLIIIGCALENYTSFKSLSDNFRYAVFHSGIYEALDRDIAFFGGERPKLFTSEPSHVSKFLLFSITLWLVLSLKKRKFYIKAILVSLTAAFVTGSPSLVLLIPISLIIAVYLEGNGFYPFLKRMSIRKFLLYFVFMLLMLGSLTVAVTTVLSGRLTAMIEGEGSTIIRVVAPPLITFDVLKEYPMWGAGITGKEMVADKVFYRLTDDFGLTYITDIEWATNMVTNAFWLHWIYLGLFGGILMVWAIYRLMKVLGVKHYLYCLFLILIFSQTMGGYVGARTWMILFGIFLTSVLIRNEHEISSHFVSGNPLRSRNN
ncbi:hypothetical protein [Candidatus Parabeggiatoa sp. HSG14]|uniref:hypothetical protein n=1 Tax=Candidatus Parabeggiatoa sp. HSG14 TaxID=3055593 RepID=UPI0025A88ADD|nr:hypothetical protein [Thiotrichales bacterium HSG14]